MTSGKKVDVTYLMILTSVVLWGISFIWTNRLLRADLGVFTIIFFRILIASCILIGVNSLTKKLQRPAKRDLKWFVMMAFFEPFIYFIGETWGMKTTGSPTISAVVVSMFPVFAMVMDRIVFKTRLSGWKIFGMLITVPGIFLLVAQGTPPSPEYWWGILLLFTGVLGSVGYTICVRHLSAYNGHTIVTWQFSLGALMFLPAFLIFDLDSFNPATLLSPHIIMPLLALSVFCSCIAFFLYINSIQHIGITRTAIFTSLIPIVSAIGAYICGQEQLTLIQTAGIIIVVSGVILVNKK